MVHSRLEDGSMYALLRSGLVTLTLYLVKDGNVWATDHGVNPPNGKGQVVYKFSPDGKVLLTLGKPGVAGSGPDTFNQPSDVLVAPSGDIFVADGHGPQTNARIVKF